MGFVVKFGERRAEPARSVLASLNYTKTTELSRLSQESFRIYFTTRAIHISY